MNDDRAGALPKLALMLFAVTTAAVTGCSSGSGSPDTPIAGQHATAAPTATPTAAPSASPTASGKASASPIATASPTIAPSAQPSPTASATGLAQQCAPVVTGPVANTGYILTPIDGDPSGFSRIQIESGGSLNSSPQNSFCTTYSFNSSVNDVYSLGSSDGIHGLALGDALNGTANGVQYAAPFAGANNAIPTVGTLFEPSAFAEPDSTVVIPDTGDEAVATAVIMSGPALVIFSGVKSGTLHEATPISLGAQAAGVVLAADGKTLAVRFLSSGNAVANGLSLYRVDAQAAAVSSLGGSNAHAYTLTGSFDSGTTTGVINVAHTTGRSNMAPDPADPAKIVLAGYDPMGGSGTDVQLVTGLPNAPALGAPLALMDTSNSGPQAITVSRDGKYAYVATRAGIAMVGGIDTGAPAQIGTTSYLPSAAPALSQIVDLAVTVDGKYLLAATTAPAMCPVTVKQGYCDQLVVLPIGTGGALGAPALIYNAIGGSHGEDMLVF